MSWTLVGLVLVIIFVALLPSWPYSRGWGYRGPGVVAIILGIFLLLWLLDATVV